MEAKEKIKTMKEMLGTSANIFFFLAFVARFCKVCLYLVLLALTPFEMDNAILFHHFTLSCASTTFADSSFRPAFILSNHLCSGHPLVLISSATNSIGRRAVWHLSLFMMRPTQPERSLTFPYFGWLPEFLSLCQDLEIFDATYICVVFGLMMLMQRSLTFFLIVFQ